MNCHLIMFSLSNEVNLFYCYSAVSTIYWITANSKSLAGVQQEFSYNAGFSNV